jgi:hypothetical protein
MMDVTYKEYKDIDDIPIAQLKDLKAKRIRDSTTLGLI